MPFGKDDELVVEPFGKNDEVVDAKASAPQSVSNPGFLEPGSKSDAAIRGFSQMATLGFGDEAQAGIRAFLDSNKLPGESYLDAYRRLRDEQRTDNSNAQQQNPGSYLAGSAVAAAPSLVKSLPSIATKGGAAFTAIQGALAGAGNSDSSTVGGVATDAAKGAGLNLALSGAGQAVGNLIQKGANAAKTFGDKSVGNVLAKSEDHFEQALGKAIQKEPGLVDEAIKPTYLGEVLPSAMNTAKAVGGAVKDNLSSNLKRGVDTGDLLLGGVVSLVAGPHAGIGTILGKKALLNASMEAGKKHIDEIGAAARPMINAVQQKFAPVVKAALDKGTPFAAINNVLQQQSPEYREMLRAQEKLDNEEGQ